MMDFLFSILLVPFFPELGNPEENYAATVATLEQRINAGQRSTEQSAESGQENVESISNSQRLGVPQLPPITGRLFQWSSISWEDQTNRHAVVDLSAESLRLTGLIESAGQRVAILNDGQLDHVVGVGSYVLGTYQVTSFGPGRVVLSRIDSRAGEKRLELNLIPVNTPGDAQ